jgi:hypothetical protein
LQKIKIKFLDFWSDFKPSDNFLFNFLTERFNIELSDEPDYIIFSHFGFEHLKYSHCVKILYSGENITPDFNLTDYALGFHFIDFEDRYLRLPLFLLYDKELKKAEKKHLKETQNYNSKLKFCNFIYSNPHGDPIRELFFNKLSQYKFVHSAGNFLNNLDGWRVEDKYNYQKQFKFTIAFENSSSNGYSTEKILQAFSAKTIPIYWGNPLIGNDFNEKAFINCHKFDSLEHVIEHIITVDQNDKLYTDYLETPIYTNIPQSTEYRIKLFDYFNNLFNREIDQNYRRNMVFWGKEYEKKWVEFSKHQQNT